MRFFFIFSIFCVFFIVFRNFSHYFCTKNGKTKPPNVSQRQAAALNLKNYGTKNPRLDLFQ